MHALWKNNRSLQLHRLTLDFLMPDFYRIDSLIPEKHIAKNKSRKRGQHLFQIIFNSI